MKKFSMESMVETCPNNDYRTYHMRQAIVGSIKKFYSSEYDFDNDFDRLPSLTRLIVSKILAVRGVVKVSCHSYEISVVKATAFDWAEIEPQIARIFTYLPAK